MFKIFAEVIDRLILPSLKVKRDVLTNNFNYLKFTIREVEHL